MGILTIDDRDPLLSYSPAWGQGGVSSEYNGTTSIATVTGSTATLMFSGTSVDVYGTIASLAYANGTSPPETSFVVDNGSPTSFTATFTNATQYEQRFYNSGALSAGTHTLLITLLSTNSTFYLDYIQVVPLDLTTSSSSSSSSSPSISSTQTTLLSSTMSTVTRSLSASPSSQDFRTPATENAERSSHTTTIVGVSLGVLAIFILIFFAILFLRKRQRDRRFKKMLDSKIITTESLWTRYTPRRSNSFITPFITPRYQPINDETRLELLGSRASTTRVVPYDAAPTPPQKDSIPPLKSKQGFSHSPSSSQHVISTQDPLTNFSAQLGSSSNQASSSSRPAISRATLDRPPPQYQD